VFEAIARAQRYMGDNVSEDALRELQLNDREDPVTLTVAKRIIELANQGERDPVRLRDRALESLRS